MKSKEYQPFSNLIKGIPIQQATEIADYCLTLHSRIAKLEKALRVIRCKYILPPNADKIIGEALN